MTTDVPHLRCIDCGLGRPVSGALHTAAECRDNLRAELAAARAELATVRAATLREAAELARAHGAISLHYALLTLAAEVKP